MKSLITAASLALLLAQTATAQVADDPETFSKLEALGMNLSREMVGGTQALYRDMYKSFSDEGLSITRDVAYGDHERHVLDVFAPEGASGAPVMIFAHGGGFVRGDKAAVGNIAHWAARNGVVGVAFNYRLAPEATWPSGGQDVARVLAWINGNIQEHGGDPTKIIVAGNSAGSMHIADYVFREDLQIENDGVIGAILISPPTVDLDNREIDPTRDAVYYADGDRTEQSVVNAVEGRSVPVLVAYAENEPDVILDQTHRLINALSARDGRMPLIVGAAGHSHISVVGHIGTSDETLGPDMLEFIKLQVLKAK